MPRDLFDLVHDLLEESLPAWRIEGHVERETGPALRIVGGGVSIRVTRAADETPFRWMLDAGGRARGVTSIAGLLRAVRGQLDPDYKPIRLRIAPAPLVPP
jgi:hypothetical protein